MIGNKLDSGGNHLKSQQKKTEAVLCIGCPVLEVIGDKARLSALVTTSDGLKKEVWYSLPVTHKDWFSADRCDGFVVGLLLQSMEQNQNIVTASPMSSLLWHNLTNFYIPMMAKAFEHLHTIKIIPISLISNVNAVRGVATGFSAGIDSFTTVMLHLIQETSPELRITHLLFHNVGSHGTSGEEENGRLLFQDRLKYMEPFSQEVGIPIVPIDSNVSSILPIDFTKTHHALNASVLLSVQNKFNRYYYASTYPYESCGVNQPDDIGRFDPLAFHLLSTETLSCVSTGCQFSRTEKTEKVATYEPSYRYLNVCASETSQGKNCSVCFKCCRTILTLELLEQIHNYRHVFDMNKFDKVRQRYMLKILLHKPNSFEHEIARLYLKKRNNPWSAMILLRSIFNRILGKRW